MPDPQSDARPSNVGDICPGDLIFFRGRGWKSRLIMAGTGPVWDRGYSHVGFASYVTGCPDICLVDATTLDDVPCVVTAKTSGVRARPLAWHLAAYDGDAWCYPLPCFKDTSCRVSRGIPSQDFADAHLGIPYDMWGALHCRRTVICDLLWRWFRWAENFDTLYCSELCAMWLQTAGLLNIQNASRISPTLLAIAGTEQGAFGEPWRIKT